MDKGVFDDLQNEAIKSATDSIKEKKQKIANLKFYAFCITILLSIALICGCIVACFSIKKQQETILEQQYSINMQYAQLMEYIAGAEVTTTTETIDGSGGGIAAKIEGDGNSVGGSE